LKPTKWTEDSKVSEVLLVLKWGGALTHSGVEQAIRLGEQFRRSMYVEDKNEENEQMTGLLRLHSTYRHDLKCYTSDEGRCQKTAAAFLKGLLVLEGALPPILAVMVRNDDAVQEMLNDSGGATDLLEKVKG
jgi:inositol hexakisphosphate/diphosphoinositol-pentakisphosphate kinase